MARLRSCAPIPSSSVSTSSSNIVDNRSYINLPSRAITHKRFSSAPIVAGSMFSPHGSNSKSASVSTTSGSATNRPGVSRDSILRINSSTSRFFPSPRKSASALSSQIADSLPSAGKLRSRSSQSFTEEGAPGITRRALDLPFPHDDFALFSGGLIRGLDHIHERCRLFPRRDRRGIGAYALIKVIHFQFE